MNKLLLGTAAVAMGFALATPAHAQVSLDLGGHYKGYLSWSDQDTSGGSDALSGENRTVEDNRALDWQQETEIHFTGETTLDNGLTVGFHAEADIDGGTFATEESYAYFSGAWGRVNAGGEDGAAYLLQVAAPSADNNVDGLRTYVAPINYGLTNKGSATEVARDTTFDELFTSTFGANNEILVNRPGANNDIRAGVSMTNLGTTGASLFRFDYDQAVTGTANKLTYMTPVFNGFQVGASYTPEVGGNRDVGTGNNDDDSLNQFGDVYEVAARYEGQWDMVGITLGAGYTLASREADAPANSPVAYRDVNGNGAFNAGVDVVTSSLDDRQAWNVGADFDLAAFGLGVSYSEDDLGVSGGLDRDTLVIGADYTTGPFKLGVSYYDQDQDVFGNEIETQRYTGGVVYTYGPGMTFRGSLGFIDHDFSGTSDLDATFALVGTQINF